MQPEKCMGAPIVEAGEAYKIAAVVNSQNSGAYLIWNHELNDCSVDNLEAVNDAVRELNFSRWFCAGLGCVIEAHNLATVVDPTCFRCNSTGDVDRSIGKGLG